jgi:RHS repeat-associated protein
LGYDAALRLYETLGGGVTTRFLYDGTDLIAEYDGANVLKRRYVHGPGVDEPLAWYEGTTLTDKRFLHADERGSIIAVSNSAGTSIATNKYDEYGIPAATNVGRFGYTGQTWLPEVGMWYYKARMYSPTLGRFLQTDLVRHGYTSGDPVNRTDPSGLSDSTCRGTGECTVHDVERYKYWGSGGAGWATITATAPCSSRVFNGNNGSCFPSGGGVIANFPGGSGSGASNATPAQPQTKMLSPCMISFLGTQGFNSKNLSDVTFYDGANGSLIASTAFSNGNPAITVRNNVYVAPGYWRSISTPNGGATFFEETVHTVQWSKWGTIGFVATYGVASGMGKYKTGDAHNNPVENQAIQMSNQLFNAYTNLPKNQKCSD